MEIWEPPKSTGTEAPRRKRPVIEAPRRALPEIWLMVALRAAIVIVLLSAVVLDQLRAQMSFVALFLVVGLIVMLIQSDRDQTQKLRRQVIVDLVTLLIMVPVAVLNGFVAAEPGELLPAEQSSLLQTTGGLLIAVALLIWLTTTLFVDDRALLPAVMLPGLLIILMLTFILHDYRSQTVLAMLTASYLIGAAAVALGFFVDEQVQRYVPLVFYGATLVAGMLLFDPGLGNLFDREGMVQLFSGMMIVIGLAALFVTPNPTFDSLSFGGSGSNAARREADHRARRSRRDSRRDAASRG